MTDEKRKEGFREKIRTYIDRAEKLKKLVDEIKECKCFCFTWFFKFIFRLIHIS